MSKDSQQASKGLPVWRSLLYVPANNPRFIDKAHTRGADGVILDLEDSVPAQARDAARKALADAAAGVGSAGADVLVRINSNEHDWRADLDAACVRGVTALVVPKVESAEALRSVSAEVSALETSRNLGAGAIRFFVLIETPAGFFQARQIAEADSRVVAMSLGGEDFALSLNMTPQPEHLLMPKQWTLIAARAAGIVPLGLIGSIADYGDLAAMKTLANRSRDMGFEGAACIHPGVVPVLNQAFTPSAEDVATARRVVDAYAQACSRGVGAIELDGKMVDVPVALRAKRLLDRSTAIATRHSH